jgi:hypothetical protein
MARTWAELRQLSKDKLIQEYDKQALTTTTESLAYIRDVIFQRDQDEQGDRMEKIPRDSDADPMDRRAHGGQHCGSHRHPGHGPLVSSSDCTTHCTIDPAFPRVFTGLPDSVSLGETPSP